MQFSWIVTIQRSMINISCFYETGDASILSSTFNFFLMEFQPKRVKGKPAQLPSPLLKKFNEWVGQKTEHKTRIFVNVAGHLWRRRGKEVSDALRARKGRPLMPGHDADGENLMHLSTAGLLRYGDLEDLLTVCLSDPAPDSLCARTCVCSAKHTFS